MVVQLLVPRDAEALVVTYLRAQLAARSVTAHVGTRVPSTRPAQLVKVTLAGNNRTLPLDAHMLVLDCWAATESAASDLARLVAGLVAALPGETVGGAYVYDADLVGGPVNLPDPDSSSPRYSVTCRVWTRAAVTA